MGLFTVDPEDLSTGFLQNLPFLLDGWCIDPVLGIQQSALAFLLGGQHPIDAGQSCLEGYAFVGPLPVKLLGTVAEVAGQGFFANDKLVPLQPGDGDRLVKHRRHADVNRVDRVQKPVEGLEESDSAFLSVRLALFGILRVDADNLDIRPVDLAQCLVMERGRKARTDDTRANGFLLHGVLFPSRKSLANHQTQSRAVSARFLP